MGDFDDTAYRVVGQETADVSKFNNMLTALKASLNDIAEAQFASGKLFALSKLKTDGAVTGDGLQFNGTDWVPAASAAATPPGIMSPYGGASAPSGWLLCDGSAVSRTTYSALFAIVGTNYGVGDGSTTFNLPDHRGRVPVGKGTHVDVDTIGENDGSALADRRPKHKHTVTDPGHVHSVANIAGNAASAAGATNIKGDAAANSVSAVTGVTVGPQTTVPTDAPAYLVHNYIIKT